MIPEATKATTDIVDKHDNPWLQIEQLQMEIERLKAIINETKLALEYYADQYCEGWCDDNPSGCEFDDCGGCKARTVLSNATTPSATWAEGNQKP